MPPIARPIKPPESLPEERHQAEEAHSHAEPEGPHLQEVAAGEQEPSERNERDGQHVRSVADDLSQRMASHEPTAPPSRPR